MMKNYLILLLQFCLFFSCTNLSENQRLQEENSIIQEARKAGKLLSGKAISITDGDTFKLLVEGNETVRIRLHGVDAPEKGQDYATQAKQLLSELVFSNNVAVIQKTKDRYGRVVGIVYADGVNVNEELLAEGMVWHYTAYDKNEDWAALQRAAKTNKRGLWNKRNPTPPWQWRKEKRTVKAGTEEP